MIEPILNLDVTKIFEYTCSYEDWKYSIDNNETFNNILHIIIKMKSHIIYRSHIKYFLSYYLYPQNHNILTYGNLYSKQLPGNLSLALSYMEGDNIIESFKYNSNNYYKFNDEIEKIILREYNLYHLLKE